MLSNAKYMYLIQCHQYECHKDDMVSWDRHEKYRKTPRYLRDEQTGNPICMDCKEVMAWDQRHEAVLRDSCNKGMLFFEMLHFRFVSVDFGFGKLFGSDEKYGEEFDRFWTNQMSQSVIGKVEDQNYRRWLDFISPSEEKLFGIEWEGYLGI